jgi:DNA invertase Pin-like site-specific DNA recombinase
MNPTKRVALYARVSTAKCEKCGKIRTEHDNHNHEFKGQDPEVQLRELRGYIEHRGWRLTEAYTDAGVSGAKDSRPELNRLMIDAGRRRFDVVIVWRFDRFARSVSHLLRALEQFQALGIDFVSLSENVDTSTPTGKMVFTILGAVAELERSLIVERVKAGIRNARAKGKRIGRPGTKVNPATVLVLRSGGESVRAIAAQLHSSIGTVSRILAASAQIAQASSSEVLHV